MTARSFSMGTSSRRFAGEGVQTQFPVSELTPGKIVRDDKGKTLGLFGKAEERVRVDFDRLPLAIWVPLERQAEAEAFVAEANDAIESASS
jgi:hypothetical protein